MIRRRKFITTLGRTVGAVITAIPFCRAGQWPDEPSANNSSRRIAPENEPGNKLAIAGRVFEADGRTPAASVIVYAYHTDASGLYRPDHYVPDWQNRRPRLEGTLKTAGDGSFQFLTIRPAPYPHRTNPAHVHFVLWWPDGHRQGDTLWFEGDPLITSEMQTRNAARAEFAHIRSVKKTESAQYVESRFRKHDGGDDTW